MSTIDPARACEMLESKEGRRALEAAIARAIPKAPPETPDSCERCRHALYDGDEIEACTHDPQPPDNEPWPGCPCRFWEAEDLVPPYLTDRGLAWEMVDALSGACRTAEIVILFHPARHWQPESHWHASLGRGTPLGALPEADTINHALALAMAEAGLLEERDDARPDR